MIVPPLLFALIAWFVGTGVVVWLDSRPAATFRISFRWAGVVALAATVAVWWSAGDPSAGGAYLGFMLAIVIWGWHELGFLMGFVAGPRREAMPASLRGWRRFRAATATVIHHEVALAATVVALIALTWDQPNQSAPLAFALLFGLRLSAKLNLFLGVPNLSDEVFPAHLAYLKSYFGTRRFNWLMPLSLAGASGLAWAAWDAAGHAPPGSGAHVTALLLTGLAALGVVEHLFLILPLKDGALWRWADQRRVPAPAPAVAPPPTSRP